MDDGTPEDRSAAAIVRGSVFYLRDQLSVLRAERPSSLDPAAEQALERIEQSLEKVERDLSEIVDAASSDEDGLSGLLDVTKGLLEAFGRVCDRLPQGF